MIKVAISVIVATLFSCTSTMDLSSAQFVTANDIMWAVATNIEYKSDISVHGVREYWQSPRETLSNGTGDCEDYAILAGWLIEKNLNEECLLICVTNSETGLGHAVLSYNNIWYSAEYYNVEEDQTKYTVDFVYTINEAISMCVGASK